MAGLFTLNTVLKGALMFAALCITPHATRAAWFSDDKEPGITGCILETEDISLFDGYQETRLRLSVADGKLLVKTESNIDLSFSDVGLAVDGKNFIPADGVTDEKHVLFVSDTDAMFEQFIRGRTVTVHLRFWPTYPATQSYKARFSLMGFTRAYNNYKECLNKTQS